MKIRKYILILALWAGIIITQTGCGSQEPVSENQFCLDTICTITVYHMDKEEAQAAIDAAFAACRQYENLMSKTIEGSDIYKLNKAKGKPVRVHDATLEVIKKGIQYGDLSDGMFDITVGALSELWNFNGENPKVPDKASLEKARATVDYRQIQIDGNSVSMENPHAQIDLGGIGKGYIADRATEVLEAKGAEHAIVNFGGNIVALGEKETDTPWKIGVERPYSDRTQILGSVNLTDETIVTSGVYERYFKEKGKLYHHVLNPKTGYPVETDLDAVTVKGQKGQSMDCDALSTICLMLGKEKSKRILDTLEGVQAAFIDKNDHITTVTD